MSNTLDDTVRFVDSPEHARALNKTPHAVHPRGHWRQGDAYRIVAVEKFSDDKEQQDERLT